MPVKRREPAWPATPAARRLTSPSPRGGTPGAKHSGTACPQSRSGSRDAVAATAARQRSAIVVPSEAAKRRTAAASARG